MSKRLVKHIFRKVRNANLKYHLVEDGDKLAAALSGGKDSFTMLYFLVMLQKYTPLKFEILPVYIDLGWNNDVAPMDDFCKSLGLSLTIEKTNIGQVVFDRRQESNPCSLCSNLRRGAINRLGKTLGCNKVALGHHMDDVVNTLFLSMIFEGRFNVFKPKTYLDRMDITFIRPLIYVSELEVRQFVECLEVKPVKNRCPADGKTKRTEISQLLEQIENAYPGARQRFLSSIENVGPDTFWH